MKYIEVKLTEDQHRALLSETSARIYSITNALDSWKPHWGVTKTDLKNRLAFNIRLEKTLAKAKS